VDVPALLTSLPLPVEGAARRVARLGFRVVDVVAMLKRPAQHIEVLAETGLRVACAAAGRDLPESLLALGDASLDKRRLAVEAVEFQLADAARLGATRAYLVPGRDASAEALSRFADSCVALADYAGGRMLRLCVEHVPGRALPTVAAALDWLDHLSHPNLFLLLDVGHCLLSREDPVEAVRRAGPRLGQIHFNDNDGVGDLHWPLLAGKLSRPVLNAVLAALRETGYDGALTLELAADLPDPEENLSRGRALLSV
jgi:sugar phosphate isomerase/epimerase